MNFNRKAFYGLTFNWYMVDTVDSIAMFMSGYGVIPTSIFENEDNYLRINTFFDSLPILSEFYYSPELQVINIDSQNYFFGEVKMAQRGIYVYDNEEYTDQYKMIAVPQTKLNFSDLPLNIKSLLKPLKLENINFSETKELNIKEYFICD